MALLAEECTLQVEIGTQAPGGGAVTWGAGVDIKVIAYMFDVEESADRVNTKTFGRARKRHRLSGGETVINIEQVVDITGLAYFSGTTMLGRPIRITMKELSTLATSKQWAGLIERWKWRGRDGEAQAESIQIICDIDEV